VPKLSVVALSPDITETGVGPEAIFIDDIAEEVKNELINSALLLVVDGGVPVNSKPITPRI